MRTDHSSIVLEPIGVMRTPFHSKYDAPRQPRASSHITPAVIELLPNHNFEQALHDLEGFERIWIISWFDRVGGWKPKVLPPRSTGKRGVFATRSPHRPNPIGLSAATLVRIDGLRIYVSDTDLLDGTPVLDIKPYVSYADAFPNSAAGWLDDHALTNAYNVTFAPDAFDEINVENMHAADEIDRLRTHIERVLSLDPKPHPYRRTKHVEGDNYVLSIRSLRVQYSILQSNVIVRRIIQS